MAGCDCAEVPWPPLSLLGADRGGAKISVVSAVQEMSSRSAEGENN